MASPPQKSSFERVQQRKRFPWILGVIASIGFLAILAFVIVTLLILQSQGISRGINTLTIISIVVSFMIGVFGLLLSFLQWHHPRPSNQPEPAQRSSLQTSPLESSERLPSPGSLVGPPRQYLESNMDFLPPPGQKSHRIDWGEAPHAEQFYGRDQELAKLKRWMNNDHCHLIAILGMGGIGKTSLAATLVGLVHENYDCVFWRSLHNAPPLESMLQACILFLSEQQQTAFPAEEDRQIALLIEYLRACRCLLVLDNVESLLQGGGRAGSYREGYEGYGKLLQRIGETRHQSCLLITSREKPHEVALLEGEVVATRSLQLGGLKLAGGRDILKDKGLQGAEHDWEVLISHYGGNPLALKLVAQVICEVFGGTITAFLTDGELFFRDVRDVLEQQLKRLSALEEEIVYWLAIEREVITLSDLQKNIVHSVPKGELQEALRSLQRRQLIETSATGFTLHHVIMEYLTDCFVERVCEEIRTERLMLFERHALLKAQAKDYIRESQRRLILLPLVQQLLTIFGQEALEQQCKNLLVMLRKQHDHDPSYAAGNVLNLLLQGGYTLRRYDCSHLVVRQAYLQGVMLPEVDFAHADLATSVFTNTFGSILSVAFSPQGDLLAVGTFTGEIRFWYAVSGTPLQTIQGHNGWVYEVAFSPDGKTLVSGSSDQTVRLWEVSSGTCLNTLYGHTGLVDSVAFSPDGRTLASGGRDRKVRLWEVSSGHYLKTLEGHTDAIRSVTFSPDGRTLASSSHDQTIRLWEVSSGSCLNTLQGHTDAIPSVAFSPDGKTLASGGGDRKVRLWEVSSGTCFKTILGLTHWVYEVAFSPDGKTLAGGSGDKMVRLWEVSSGKLLKTLQGHANEVWSVAFSPDGKTLASGGNDQMVRLWEASSGQCIKTLQGYANRVWSVAFSPDGSLMAGSYEDRTLRLWEVSSGKLLKTLQGHTETAWSVAFSPDGRTLASGSRDLTVRLWEVSSGHCLKTLQGHTNTVWSVAFSPDGRTLASGSGDRSVRLWEASSGHSKTVLENSDGLWDMSFSPDGSIIAIASGNFEDRVVGLWEVSSGRCLETLRGHIDGIWKVAFSPDGSIMAIASGSDDQTIRVWEMSNDQPLDTILGYYNRIVSVAFSPDGKTVASGGYDGVITLWDLQTGVCLQTLRSDRPYEGMNITQVKGLTEGQKATLRSLGAIEEEGQAQE